MNALWGHGHLPLLEGEWSKNCVEYILQDLWRTRRTCLDAAGRAIIRDILQISIDSELDPSPSIRRQLLVCIGILIHMCVHQNIAKEDIAKHFPEEVLAELQRHLRQVRKRQKAIGVQTKKYRSNQEFVGESLAVTSDGVDDQPGEMEGAGSWLASAYVWLLQIGYTSICKECMAYRLREHGPFQVRVLMHQSRTDQIEHPRTVPRHG